MSDSEEWQKARVMRAAEMARRALARGDVAAKDRWLAQFEVEVRKLGRGK